MLLDHPGVKRSHCEGAIGILTVKKTVDGVFLYFGHNTESFVSAACPLYMTMRLTAAGHCFHEQ